MIRAMANKTLITYLVSFHLCLMSSIAHPHDLFNHLTIPGGPMYTLNDEERLLLSKEDDVSFEKKVKEALDTIDYFSNNYPYSVEQLENYYGIEFDVRKTSGITLKPKYDSDKIFNIIIRQDSLNLQSLLINLIQNTCFNFDQLTQRLLEEGYEANPSSVFYSTNFDKIEQVEDTVISSGITINRYKNEDVGCIVHYFFDHNKSIIVP